VRCLAAVTISIVIGGVALLYDRIDDRLSPLMSVPELFNPQRTRPSTAQSIVRVVRDAHSYERPASPLPTKFLDKKTTDFANLLRGLQAGYATYSGGFWDSNEGLRYPEARREAVEERRVRVRRLFILEFAQLTADPFSQRSVNAGGARDSASAI